MKIDTTIRAAVHEYVQEFSIDALVTKTRLDGRTVWRLHGVHLEPLETIPDEQWEHVYPEIARFLPNDKPEYWPRSKLILAANYYYLRCET